MDELTDAMVELWRAVLHTDEITEDHDLDKLRCGLDDAIEIVKLVNQWLGTDLTVWELFRLRTPRGLAGHLRFQGVSARPDVLPGFAEPIPLDRTGAVQVARWQRTWDATYRFSSTRRPVDFNTAGWFDSASAMPMTHVQMREWVRATADRIRMLSPDSILEIGCGVGLLLSELAPHCSRYTGVDFSDEAIRRLRNRIHVDPALAHVDAFGAEASGVHRLVDSTYDLIVLNSVIQYFPDVGYLEEALRDALEVLRDSGMVFLGDVCNRDLRRAAHVSRFPGTTRVGQVRTQPDDATGKDVELWLSPADIVAVADDLGFGGTTDILVRRGAQPTPMNRFRFDALLSLSDRVACSCDDELDWTSIRHRFASLEAFLAAHEKPCEGVVIRAIPDSRTLGSVRLSDALDGSPAQATLVDVIGSCSAPETVDPEQVWVLGAQHGYGVAVAPSEAPGYVDAAFWRGRDDWSAAALLRRT